MKEKVVICPGDDPSCPYWKDGLCSMVDEGADPAEECDEYAFYMGDEDEDEDEPLF